MTFRSTRRLASLVLAGVGLAGAPLLGAAPAYAAVTVICVGSPAGSCDQTAASIQAAITAATGADATIRVGPGTYSDGPYILDGSGHALTLEGSGQGSTILTLPASPTWQTYVTMKHATVRNLAIVMEPALSSVDVGLNVSYGTVDQVTVDATAGAGTANARGVFATASTITRSAIEMPVAAAAQNTALVVEGASTVVDSDLSAEIGVFHSGDGTPDQLSRVRIQASYAGITTDWGDVMLDDSLIDLGSSSGAGLVSLNYNASTYPRSIAANHVTIVGGGASSKGVWVYAANQDVVQHSSVSLQNSIVRGPATDLVVQAGNKGGLGGTSTATITTSYSDWHSKTETSGANGIAQVVSGPGHLDVDPAFASAAGGDFRLTSASPVVDHGDPSAAGPALDLAGSARVADGNGDGTAVRDLGAYEQPEPAATVVAGPTAPDTLLGPRPHHRVTKPRVRFGFTSTESGATFQCRLDRHAWRSCTAPKRFRIDLGRHRFSVRATAAGRTDPTPATYRFRRVR